MNVVEKERLSDRIYGTFDHCDPAKVAMHEEVPEPNFDDQQDFMNSISQTLKEQGRDVFVSQATRAIGSHAYVKVPAIRERQSGLRGTLRGAAFRALDEVLLPADTKNLGAVLYRIGDEWEDIDDPQVMQALEQAVESHPHQQTPTMPSGTP